MEISKTKRNGHPKELSRHTGKPPVTDASDERFPYNSDFPPTIRNRTSKGFLETHRESLRCNETRFLLRAHSERIISVLDIQFFETQ